MDDPEEIAKEAIRAHATGLLAIAFTHNSHCEEAVRSHFIPSLVNHLHAAATRLDSSVELRSPATRLQAAWPMQGTSHPVCRVLQVCIWTDAVASVTNMREEGWCGGRGAEEGGGGGYSNPSWGLKDL